MTEEEKIKLIQIAILRNKEKLESNHIAGILIIVDGTSPRIHIGKNIETMIRMFGESSLKSAMIIINKFARIPEIERSNVINFVTNKARSIKGASSIQIDVVDTKQPKEYYLHLLKKKIKLLVPYKIDGINELEQKMELYFKQELENEDNYKMIITNYEPLVETKTVQTIIMIDEPYSYECNCKLEYDLGIVELIRTSKQSCDKCWGTKQIPKTILKQVSGIDYVSETAKILKNNKKHIKRLVESKRAEEVRSAVYNYQKRKKS